MASLIQLLPGLPQSREFAGTSPHTWEVYLLSAIVAMVIMTRFLRPGHFSKLSVALGSFGLANQMFRKQEGMDWPSLPLMINTILIVALEGSRATTEIWPDVGWSSPALFLVFTVVLAAALTLSRVIHPAVAAMFGFQSEQQLYDAHFVLALQLLGIVLLPLVLVEVFIEELRLTVWLLSLAAVAAMLVLTWGRGLILSRPFWSSRPAHFFLYFCALYVVPLVIAAKAFANYVLEK